jgi:putative ABC transport system permease protein
VAGSYPALFLSSFQPIKVLKGQLVQANAAITPRKFLVVLQFTFAICLILSSIFIYKQITYIRNKPIGYDRFGLVNLPDDGVMDSRFEDFRRDAINAGAITDGALTSSSIANNGSSSWGITWQGQLPGEDKIPVDQMAVTYHFVNTFGVKLVQGRDFSTEYPSDTAAIILNQAAVKMMRFKQPLGQIVKYQNHDCKVVGVIENFTWGSPYEPVKPAIIGFIKGWTSNVALRLNPAKSVSASLAILKSIYKSIIPIIRLNINSPTINTTTSLIMSECWAICRYALLAWPSLSPVWVYLDWHLFRLNNGGKKSASARFWVQLPGIFG